MCEASAYLMKDNEEILLMEAVDSVEPEGDGFCSHQGIQRKRHAWVGGGDRS